LPSRRTFIQRVATGIFGLSVAAAIAAVPGISGCAGGADEPAEIVIGQYGSLTGTAATFGISTRNGVELATEEQNAKGGVGGIKIRMVVEDDQSKAEEAATAVQKILSRDRPVAVLGEVSSSRSLAAAPLLQAASVPMISPSSTSPKVTEVGDFIFRVCFIDPFQGTAIAKFAFTTRSIKNVAILKDVKNDYSVGLAQYFSQTFTGLGGAVVAEEAYSEGDIDFKAQLTNLIAKSPEALFVPGYYTEVGLIARQARELGFTGPLLGGDGWDSDKLVEIGQDAIVGGYYTNHYSVDDPNPAVQDFIKKYEARYGAKPDGLGALGYDSARVLYQAMEKVAAANPEHAKAFGDRSNTPATEATRKAARQALRDELARTSGFGGVTGTITIDAQRNAQKPAVVVEVTKAGPKFVESIAP
jgi:branched-chain amino acid transport system substrate-binding protein